MTDLEAFLAMLTRAGVGHALRGLRPDGVAVQVETVERAGEWVVTEFLFDDAGRLTAVVC